MVKLSFFRSTNFFNSIIMKVTYELYDKDSLSLILMTLEGKKYIAPIGSEVFFLDDQWEDNKIQSYICVEFISIVTSHNYSIHEDTLSIKCEPIEYLSKDDISDVEKYHKLKYKRKC